MAVLITLSRSTTISLASRGVASIPIRAACRPLVRSNLTRTPLAIRKSSNSTSHDEFAQEAVEKEAQEVHVQNAEEQHAEGKQASAFPPSDAFAQEIIKELNNRLATQKTREKRSNKTPLMKPQQPRVEPSRDSPPGLSFRKYPFDITSPKTDDKKQASTLSLRPIKEVGPETEFLKYRFTKFLAKDPSNNLVKPLRAITMRDSAAFLFTPPSPQHRIVELEGLPLGTTLDHILAEIEAVQRRVGSDLRKPHQCTNVSIRRSEEDASVIATLAYYSATMAYQVHNLVSRGLIEIRGVVPKSSIHTTEVSVISLLGRAARLSIPPAPNHPEPIASTSGNQIAEKDPDPKHVTLPKSSNTVQPSENAAR